MVRKLLIILCICSIISGILFFELHVKPVKRMVTEVSDKVYEFVISSEDLGNKTIDKVKIEHYKKQSLYLAIVTFKDSPKKALIIVSDLGSKGAYHFESIGSTKVELLISNENHVFIRNLHLKRHDSKLLLTAA